MSDRRSNAKKISREKSIPGNKKIITKTTQNQVQQKKNANKNSNNIEKRRNIKVDYNSSNYFYNDEDYYEDYAYNKMEYYDKNQKDNNRYNKDTSDSYITVEQEEDGHLKYIPKSYVDYKASSPHMYKNKNIEYYQEEDSDNNYNGNEDIYYENEDDYDQEILSHQSPRKQYQYQKVNNYYLTQKNNNSRKIKNNNNKNIISKVVSHQINQNKDNKRKNRQNGGSIHNYGNNTNTTNNTYNNNIYYINPINVKNKSKTKKEEISDNKNKKNNNNSNNRRNYVYKNVDITINKKKPNSEKDYFRQNNIYDRALKEKYINSAILIQSIFRSYLIKVKLFVNINLYVCCKNAIMTLESLIFKRRKKIWKFVKDFISHKLYDDLIDSKINLNDFKEYLKNNKNKSKEKNYINTFHKELGDSFNIIIDNSKKENSEKKLKSKLNDIIKENNELKNQLVDNKNIEEKMKNLMDENKKNKNINDIIMKDNQQLAKKLKDIQDYRNTNLIVQNLLSIDLAQEQKLQIEELIKNNDENFDKLKKVYLAKIIYKKIFVNKNLIKDNFNKYKNIIQKLKNIEKENNFKKEISTKIIFDKIKNCLKLLKKKYFLELYYNSLLIEKEKEYNNELKEKCLKNIIKNNQQKIKTILYKAFFKYYSNIIKHTNEENNKILEEEEKQNKELSKEVLLKKIFKKYHKNRLFIFKIFMDKWNLTAKILGIRAAARDKKKKRKLKKKNNKLIYQKHFGLVDKKNSNNLGPNYSKSNHEFSYIVSNGTVIKESASNESTSNLRNNKVSISSDKKNKKNNLDKLNIGMMKKTNSLNEISNQNNKDENKDDNKENINCNEDSEEDSGDSLGLDNNSDQE